MASGGQPSTPLLEQGQVLFLHQLPQPAHLFGLGGRQASSVYPVEVKVFRNALELEITEGSQQKIVIFHRKKGFVVSAQMIIDVAAVQPTGPNPVGCCQTFSCSYPDRLNHVSFSVDQGEICVNQIRAVGGTKSFDHPAQGVLVIAIVI